MKVINIPIKDLKPAEYNPRGLTKKEREDLQASLDEFGMVEPIVVNTYEGRENIIIGGHQRYYLEKDKGKETIPAVQVSLPQDKEKELNLRLNKNNGHWEWELLKEFDQTLLKAVGFSEDELTEAFKKANKEAHEDDAPAVSTETPKSKLGEVYQLGRHRLMCGDSTKIEDVEKLMDGKKADMVFTDPPYGVSYASKNEYLNTIARGNHIQTPIENDHMDLEDTSEFIYQCFVNLRMILAEKSSYYITAPQGGDLLMMMMMMQKADLTLRHMLIWVKNNHVLGRTDYNYKHEPILFGWVNTHNFYGNGKHKFSTWEIDKPLKSDLHPTMKPVELIVNAIENSTLKDEIVADLFLGSGSTLIACEQTNRTCYGMELDPKYCDVIRKRYANLIGEGGKWELATPPAKD